MIVLDKTTISDDLRRVQFVCNIKKCKGACCVEGDAGAPLLDEEIGLLEDCLDEVKANMRPEGLRVIEQVGVYEYDMSAQLVTPLVNGRECAFANFTDGIAWCAIERTWEQKKISFRKPVSCHLYPVRITDYDTFEAVNYHEWHICRPALVNGRRNEVPLYVFLKDALTRRYGKKWYDALLKEIEAGGKA